MSAATPSFLGIRIAYAYAASKFNKQILFFDGHGSHFVPNTMVFMASKHVQTFIHKSGNSINNKQNDNGANANLKAV